CFPCRGVSVGEIDDHLELAGALAGLLVRDFVDACQLTENCHDLGRLERVAGNCCVLQCPLDHALPESRLPLNATLLFLFEFGLVLLFQLLAFVSGLLILGPCFLLHVFQPLSQLLALLCRQILAGQRLFQRLLDFDDLGLVLPTIFGQNFIQVFLRKLGRLLNVQASTSTSGGGSSGSLCFRVSRSLSGGSGSSGSGLGGSVVTIETNQTSAIDETLHNTVFLPQSFVTQGVTFRFCSYGAHRTFLIGHARMPRMLGPCRPNDRPALKDRSAV